MPDAFFASDKKRKRPNRSGPSRPTRPAKPAPRSKPRDEDVSSDSDNGALDIDTMDFRAGREDGPRSDDDMIDENETAAEKRVRLARGYLAKVREEVEAERADTNYDAAEIDKELIASRLQQDVAEAQGRIHSYLNGHLTNPLTHFIPVQPHIPTSLTLTPTALYISTKRGCVIPVSLQSLQKSKPFGSARASSEGGHNGEILCIAASDDGKWLVTGGRDKIVGVWEIKGGEPKWVTGMRGHKDAVTSIAFPPLANSSYHILTASLSRHLALASLSTLSIIDTFYGHQDSITSVSALKPTTAVTAGSRDRTCRWWKVEEEVQLVFRGGGRSFEGTKGIAAEAPKERLGGGFHEGVTEEDVVRKPKGKGREFVEGSIDCVCALDDQYFVSGGDSGSISLWHTGKKKPIYTQTVAHGVDEAPGGARWITSLAALRGTDLFASGSWDGSIRLWALNPNFRSFSPANTHEIHIQGFVNGLHFLSLPPSSIDSSKWSGSGENGTVSGDATSPKQSLVLAVAVAQEPRLGRWIRLKDGVRNGAFLVHLQLDEAGLAKLP